MNPLNQTSPVTSYTHTHTALSHTAADQRLLTDRYLNPSTLMIPAKNPTIMEPNGVSIISPAVPTATPPARAAFWMWTFRGGGDKMSKSVYLTARHASMINIF